MTDHFCGVSALRRISLGSLPRAIEPELLESGNGTIAAARLRPDAAPRFATAPACGVRSPTDWMRRVEAGVGHRHYNNLGFRKLDCRPTILRQLKQEHADDPGILEMLRGCDATS
jgi:hypothetical protein